MFLIVEIVFWRVSFDKFYFSMLSHFCSSLMICKSSKQETGGFPTCSLVRLSWSWPSWTAGKRIAGFSANTIPMYLCIAACNAVQRRGNLVKSFWTGKYELCKLEKNRCKYETGCIACHTSSRCQTFLSNLIFAEIKMMLSWLHDSNFSKQSQGEFFAFVSAFSAAVNRAPFSQVKSHICLVKKRKTPSKSLLIRIEWIRWYRIIE